MTKTFCDACHDEIAERFPGGTPLVVRIPVRGKDGEAYEFAASITCDCWRFDSTDKHFCHACWVKAVKVAVDEIPQPHNCKDPTKEAKP